jgi:hypothetical protein
MVFSVEENDEHFELGVKSKYTSNTILKNIDNPFAEAKNPEGRDRSKSKILTTPLRISKLKHSDSTPVQINKRTSLLDDDPEPDVRIDEDFVVNKPLIYVTNSNSKSMVP